MAKHRVKQRLLWVVMDGVGENTDPFGNAVYHAHTPHLDTLRTHHPFTTLYAHGPHVGLPHHSDMGNSEVGHNTMGAGRIYDQGAQCVLNALQSGKIFLSETWQKLMAHVREQDATLHFLGLLSDGNVHSHEQHLYALMEKAAQLGIPKIRLHLLLDGRDVPPKSAHKHIERLLIKIQKIESASGCHIKIASGGGRMRLTMDRYEADWAMVERGWRHHVLGEGKRYSSIHEYLDTIKTHSGSDQYLEGFVITDHKGPTGKIESGDAVVCFNFRADRAIQISRAFVEKDFPYFDRQIPLDVFYVGLTSYDGDLHIPQNTLVSGPQITECLSWLLCERGIRQWACSETQKFGHVTFFWNGNVSGYFDQGLEKYHEIPSLEGYAHHHPEMQARAITELTMKQLASKKYDFLRINFPNGDMVGHSGNFEASVRAVEVVDQMIGKLMRQCVKTNVALMITADHGNCEVMKRRYIEGKKQIISEVTSHSTHKVPLYIYNSHALKQAAFSLHPLAGKTMGLSHLAATALDLMGLEAFNHYQPSILTTTQLVH